jgi:hypothetical protein
MDFMHGLTAKMDKKNLAKTLKGAYIGIMWFKKIQIDSQFSHSEYRRQIKINFQGAMLRILQLAHLVGD